MVQLFKLFSAIALTAAAVGFDSAVAHPGANHVRSLEEVANSQLFKANAYRSLEACANSKHMRELQEKAATRRAAQIEALRNERRRLSAAQVIAKNHKSPLTGITPAVDPKTLFGTKVACVLEPESTEGPYYVRGELIRNDIRENQAGVDLYVDLQLVDVNTCTPISNVYIDFWHCNSTGVYSGVVAASNGNINDKKNINATHSRGLAPTDANGIVQFVTKYPGHYTGRAHHIHVLTNYNGKVLPNNTYSGGKISHVGQIFFDQSLSTAVETTAPYTSNKQRLTTNAQDSIFSQEAATGFDPVVNYVYLGNSVSDGIFSWISVGVDARISKTVKAAATWTASGGKAN